MLVVGFWRWLKDVSKVACLCKRCLGLPLIRGYTETIRGGACMYCLSSGLVVFRTHLFPPMHFYNAFAVAGSSRRTFSGDHHRERRAWSAVECCRCRRAATGKQQPLTTYQSHLVRACKQTSEVFVRTS